MSFRRGIVDTLSLADRTSSYARRTLRNIVLRNTLGLLQCAPLLLLAPLARNTIVLLYDLRRELGKVLSLFPPELLYPLPSFLPSSSPVFVLFRSHFVYHHLTHLRWFGSLMIRSYDFYPVNNVDFSMMSSPGYEPLGSVTYLDQQRIPEYGCHIYEIYNARGKFYIFLHTILFLCTFLVVSM